MASVEDFPFADFKYGSLDSNTNSNAFGLPSGTEVLNLDLFDEMDHMSTNLAFLEEKEELEESSPLSSVPAQIPMTLAAPSMIMPQQVPPQQIHQLQQHHQPQQQLQQVQQHLLPLEQTHHHPVAQTQYPPVDSQMFYDQQSAFIQSTPYDAGFPPVHAFVPPVTTPAQATNQQMEFQTPQRQRNMSEADIYDTIQHDLHESPLSLSPESVIASSVAQSYSTAPSYIQDDLPALSSLASDLKRYKVIRGISSGGSATKPPRVVTLANHHYAPVSLELVGATLHDLCLPQWSDEEKQDRRRIIRVERFQIGSRIVAQFSILGSAKENPKTMPAAPGVDVVEVSCLDCYTSANEDEDEYSDSADYGYKTESELKRAFYITSVEVIKVVELLIGTEVQDAVERRRERGRIRSNLVPFWSKKPISSRMSNQEIRNSPLGSDSLDFRVELATRIMSYEVRKPRGFDKEVRILKWDKLVPALKRALQSYYVEVPDDLEEAF